MNILFIDEITKERLNGVKYYRLMIPGKKLEERGHNVKFNVSLGAHTSDGKFAIIGDDIEWADVIVFPRYFMASPNLVVGVMEYAKKLKKRIVYETDDYLFEIPEHNPVAELINLESSQALIRYLMKNATVKTVTTRRLQELIGGDLCPNSLDLREWEGIENQNNDPDTLRIGWSGGHTHRKDLEMIADILAELKKKYRFEVHLLGYDPNIPHTQLYYKTSKFVNVLDYNKTLADKGFDIGIAPLVDDEFNQYKSNIKWLEYSMLGIPTVATALPPYEDIEDGVTGFLAKDVQEFKDKLELLIKDAKLRKKIGAQAKKYVIENYDIDKTIVNWEKAFGGKK